MNATFRYDRSQEGTLDGAPISDVSDLLERVENVRHISPESKPFVTHLPPEIIAMQTATPSEVNPLLPAAGFSDPIAEQVADTEALAAVLRDKSADIVFTFLAESFLGLSDKVLACVAELTRRGMTTEQIVALAEAQMLSAVASVQELAEAIIAHFGGEKA